MPISADAKRQWTSSVPYPTPAQAWHCDDDDADMYDVAKYWDDKNCCWKRPGWILSHAESCGSDAFHNIELIYLIRVLFGRDIKSVQREWGCLYVAEEEDRWPTWLSTGQMYFHNTFRLDVRRETGRHRQQGWASEGAWGRKSRSEVGTIWCPPGHPPLAAVCQPAPKCHLPAILGGIAHCAHRFVPRVNDKVCFIAYVCLHTRLHSWIPVYVGIKNCL